MQYRPALPPSGPVDHQKRPLAKNNFMENTASKLQSSGYILLCQSFKEWLQILGYSEHSVPALTYHIRDFLRFQEQHQKPTLQQLTAMDATDFIDHLQTIISSRTKKPYSSGHINKYIQALLLFSRFVRATGKSDIGFTIARKVESRATPAWLTKTEIQRLYAATADNVLGIRDRAMLAVYYGCGLRLNEGRHLHTSDISHDKKILHVRKGKHYKERLVPIAQKNYQELKLYIDWGRPQLLQQIKTDALFIDANKGRAMHKQSLYVRIKRLVKIAKINKKVGAHTLRHSIATHLLQSGMTLERIKDFLGHDHLDSTQIYTHLTNEPV
jgi:integrase/recombinase XerD